MSDPDALIGALEPSLGKIIAQAIADYPTSTNSTMIDWVMKPALFAEAVEAAVDIIRETFVLIPRAEYTAEVEAARLRSACTPSENDPDQRGPRLVPRRDPYLCWRIHPGATGSCQLPDGHDQET